MPDLAWMHDKHEVELVARVAFRIRSRRLEVKGTQAETARAAHLAPSTYNNCEAARQRFTLGQVVRVADFLGVTVDELTKP